MNENKEALLDRQLLNACLSEAVDYASAESLLRQGANPMGKITSQYGEHTVSENLYDLVIDHLFDNENTPEDLYTITDLFLRYGMDITKPSVPYEDHETYPLWMFAFHGNDCIIRTLKLFLDHGLSATAAADCWGHAIFDLVNIDGYLNDAFGYEIYYDYIRKLMLIASYPHILENDEYLREEIWLEQNQYDLVNFRNWQDFRFEISTPEGDPPGAVYKSIVTIVEKRSERPVWRFGVCLEPDDYPELWLSRESQ